MFDLDNIAAEETAVNDLEEVVMGLIINSGQARSLAYAALKQAKQGDGCFFHIGVLYHPIPKWLKKTAWDSCNTCN
jgi:hypothetical protein